MHGLTARSNWKEPSEHQPQQLMRHPTQLMDMKTVVALQSTTSLTSVTKQQSSLMSI